MGHSVRAVDLTVKQCPQAWNPVANDHPSDLLARTLVGG